MHIDGYAYDLLLTLLINHVIMILTSYSYNFISMKSLSMYKYKYVNNTYPVPETSEIWYLN